MSEVKNANSATMSNKNNDNSNNNNNRNNKNGNNNDIVGEICRHIGGWKVSIFKNRVLSNLVKRNGKSSLYNKNQLSISKVKEDKVSGLQKIRAEEKGQAVEGQGIGKQALFGIAITPWPQTSQLCFQNQVVTTELRFNQVRVSHFLT